MNRTSHFWCDRDQCFNHYQYELTGVEELQLWLAYFKALFSPLKCPADYMTPELESLVCGNTPERYRRIG